MKNYLLLAVVIFVVIFGYNLSVSTAEPGQGGFGGGPGGAGVGQGGQIVNPPCLKQLEIS